MGKSSQEKIDFARQLLRARIPYRDIQDMMKSKFGSGMSNNTLQSIVVREDKIEVLMGQLTECRKELELYKKLYFELFAAMKDKISA